MLRNSGKIFNNVVLPQVLTTILWSETNSELSLNTKESIEVPLIVLRIVQLALFSIVCQLTIWRKLAEVFTFNWISRSFSAPSKMAAPLKKSIFINGAVSHSPIYLDFSPLNTCYPPT
eukprot:NODE_617_length_5938_cov_0.189416.p4 type:complete len:118 gc:universal NODE_617_length_5938_cov_0.189416:1674-2027(+)